MKSLVLFASENDALPKCKVGGIADVIRDVPIYLSKAGWQVDVVTPGYGFIPVLSNAEFISSFSVPFAESEQEISVYRAHENESEGVRQWILDCDQFAPCGVPNIYCDDGENRPFETDATKYALFCAASAEWLCYQKGGFPDVIHLNDWHTSLIGLLRQFELRYEKLKTAKLVYSIHNLALQGIRPLAGHDSALESWFPELDYDGAQIVDPRYTDCINLMRTGINLADQVHTVSPTYAREITNPSNPALGFFGGEGLEADLQKRLDDGRLHGILNGCVYDEYQLERVTFMDFLEATKKSLLGWISERTNVPSRHFIALRTVERWMQSSHGGPVVSSIGRVTEQKVLIPTYPKDNHDTLYEIAEIIKAHEGKLIIMGSGDKKLEKILLKAAALNDNVLFINGYDPGLSDLLYSLGNLFLMPSSFEPCGISQMLAMRVGQPCLVHEIGGLKDTVTHERTGFTFNGEDLAQQSQNMKTALDKALELYKNSPEVWRAISHEAAQQRFSWEDSVKQYEILLYSNL